jgi:hypothetical protein
MHTSQIEDDDSLFGRIFESQNDLFFGDGGRGSKLVSEAWWPTPFAVPSACEVRRGDIILT